MLFLDEVAFNGKVYVSFKSLEVSGVVNLEALKYHVKEKNISAYRVWITEPYTARPAEYPAGCSAVAVETYVEVRPYFPRENDKEFIWIYTSYCKSELEKLELIPTAEGERENSRASAIRESAERTIEAAYLVGKWAAASGSLPGGITKANVQDFLGRNDFGYGDTALFKDVWKAMPYSDKNAGAVPRCPQPGSACPASA